MVQVARVTGILLQPAATWKTIETEFAKPADLWLRYILPLAAIGPVCTMIGTLIFGQRIILTGTTARVPVAAIVQRGIGDYALELIAVFLLAQIISFLAPNFGGQRNDVQALKVSAYASTPHWVGGVFALLPALGLVSLLLSLYSLYLLYVGLPVVMKAPRDQATPYTAIVIIAAIVVFLIMSAVVAAF